MEPKSERQVKRWMEKQPCPVEEMFPQWLLECKKICCRRNRKELGIERIEDDQALTHKCKTLSEEHKRNIRIAMKKFWDRKKGKEIK